MKVKDVMMSPVKYCGPEDNLSVIAKTMWDGDYGILPVVNHHGQVIGMITDRDICMSVTTKNKLASDISVWETISGKIFSCSPDDNIKEALKTMEREQVRRLPVVDPDGYLKGIVSMNDIIVHAEKAKTMRAPSYSYADVVKTMEGICSHRPTVTAG